MVERYLAGYFAGFGKELPPPGLYDRVIRQVELPLLTAALAATRGNQIRAAELLGLNRNTLRKRSAPSTSRFSARRRANLHAVLPLQIQGHRLSWLAPRARPGVTNWPRRENVTVCCSCCDHEIAGPLEAQSCNATRPSPPARPSRGAVG